MSLTNSLKIRSAFSFVYVFSNAYRIRFNNFFIVTPFCINKEVLEFIMKKLFVAIILFFCIITQSFANDIRYYTVSKDTWTFNKLTKDEYKNLKPVDKQKYKKILKANNYLNKGVNLSGTAKAEKFLLKAIKYDPDLIPAYDYLAWHYFDNKNYNNAIYYALQIENSNNIGVYKLLGYSYYYTNDYSKSYEYLKKYLANNPTDNISKTDAYMFLAADLRAMSENLQKNIFDPLTEQQKKYLFEAIQYANKVSDIEPYKYYATDIKYISYLRLKNYKEALKQANILLKMKENAVNYMRIATCTSNIDTKIKNYYLARKCAENSEEMFIANDLIIQYEQEKIDNAITKLKIYVKKPMWTEIYKEASQYATEQVLIDKQDKFFSQSNYCMKNYTGQNLANCFKELNQEQDKLLVQLKDDQFKRQQLLQQQLLIQQQQYANKLQAQQNYYQHQQTFYQQQQYINNQKTQTYTITPVGNTIYVNKY